MCVCVTHNPFLPVVKSNRQLNVVALAVDHERVDALQDGVVVIADLADFDVRQGIAELHGTLAHTQDDTQSTHAHLHVPRQPYPALGGEEEDAQDTHASLLGRNKGTLAEG